MYRRNNMHNVFIIKLLLKSKHIRIEVEARNTVCKSNYVENRIFDYFLGASDQNSQN